MSKFRIKQGVRIRDVAAAAGVSKTTVSLIVNGRADQVGISLATRQRVTDVVRQMGYVPSSAAREMATGPVAVAAVAAPVAVSQPLPPTD
jgi:LacI family transcriptional regulator